MGLAIITGANRGIGLSLATQLKARSETVVAVCRTPSSELASLGVEIIDGIDVTKNEARGRVAAALAGRTIDLLIHNAGILRSSSLESLDENAIIGQFQTNALAPLMLTQALLSSFKDGSKIALVTSRMGSVADNGSGGSYGYRMSKSALNAAGKSLAIDLAARGVSVAILHPGFVRTSMTGNNGMIDPDDSATLLIKRIDALTPQNSGTFWHANGDVLPW